MPRNRDETKHPFERAIQCHIAAIRLWLRDSTPGNDDAVSRSYAKLPDHLQHEIHKKHLDRVPRDVRVERIDYLKELIGDAPQP